MLWVALLLALPVAAQDAPPGTQDAPPPDAGREEPQAPPPEREDGASRAGSESADVFIPSEEIAADEEVTFPVDI